MMPHDVMRTSIPELLAFIDGYRNRLKESWEQSRIIAYTVHTLPYMIFGKGEEMVDMEDWLPLWFDPSPEERRNREKVNRLKQGMVAEHQIEAIRKLGIDI